MKKLLTLFFAMLLSTNIFAQAPSKMSYQAVIRGSDNKLVVNSKVGMRISIQKLGFGLPPSYTTVYAETQNPATNDNGLVSIEIGTGSVITGNFAGIEWGNGTYFIKTDIDPAGGTNYTITAKSQILSVPYAFYAGYAENTKKYKVGDFAHGGIVFWVDDTGQHGLVCAKQDQSEGIKWYHSSNFPLVFGDGPFSGRDNSTLIIAARNADMHFEDIAASICNSLKITEGNSSYGDWYLPSFEELKLMYQNKEIINATAAANGGNSFASASYWSSTVQMNNTIIPTFEIKSLNFSNGTPISFPAVSNTFRVRAVRAF